MKRGVAPAAGPSSASPADKKDKEAPAVMFDPHAQQLENLAAEEVCVIVCVLRCLLVVCASEWLWLKRPGARTQPMYKVYAV